MGIVYYMRHNVQNMCFTKFTLYLKFSSFWSLHFVGQAHFEMKGAFDASLKPKKKKKKKNKKGKGQDKWVTLN